MQAASSPGEFYNKAYSGASYASFFEEKDHFAASELRQFVAKFGLGKCRCLEIGSGRGAFQDVVHDYTGTDLSDVVAPNYHKPFYAANAESLPFCDNSFDAIWTITVLEHVPNPERALHEVRRVLKPGGILFLKPAWNCRSWICEGIPVRPYSTLSIRQKIIKLSLPVRDSLWFRAALTLPRRLVRSGIGVLKRTERLKFRKLPADYSKFWMVDSDACSSIDPFDAIQWFRSNGDDVLSHPTWRSSFLSRSEHLIVRVNKS